MLVGCEIDYNLSLRLKSEVTHHSTYSEYNHIHLRDILRSSCGVM